MIFCFVVGTDLSSVFEVDGQIKMTTAELKDMIYEKIKNYFENKKIDASDLNLWLVDIPYNTENVQLRTLQNRSRDMNEENIIQELGGKKLSPVDDIGDIFTYDSKNIRIIIQPPITTDQGHTDVSRVIANLGYLPRQGGLGGTMLPSDPKMKIRYTNEGVNINDPDISLRFDIISPLVKDLMDKKVILVRAPPFSGKTSLAQILEYNLVHAPEFLNHRIVRVSMIWGQMVGVENCFDSFGELWKRIIGIDWFDWLEQCRFIETILIIDEAQLIYGREKKVDEQNRKSADQFWMIVKGLLQEVTRINIIMFAPYGYRSSNTTGLTTPVTLPESNCKSLIDINFTCDELEKYIGEFCEKYFRNLDSSGISNLYKYIQVVTEGHAGLVRRILMSTEDAMKKRIDTNRLTWEEIFKYLNSREFDSSIYANCRAVPKVSALFDRQKKICEDVCLNEKILYRDDDKDAEYLVRSGILIIVDTYITFAAPLHKRLFFQQNYGVHNSDETTPTDLHHFIVKIFTAMCNELSGKILRDTLGFGSDGRILEQTWQKEFYRIGTQVLGRNHFLSFEVGSVFGCEGKIVFYVDKLDWAIEFLRDGEDMAKHKRKFEPGGEYREIVKYAKSIAIIDICSKGRVDTCNEAKKVQEMKADFIYVSCSKDFDAFKIECLGKETVIIKV